jgi:redox-sensitive bicupin YhaK (pirin superfamily)
MINIIRYEDLGHANHGWLDARHHFSFARYWNPSRMEFGALRVINDDRIEAGKGFGAHPHDERDVAPRWEAKEFPKAPATDTLSVLVSGMAEHAGKDALFIHQDAAIYGGTLEAGASLKQNIKHQAYILASRGDITVNGTQMKQGDGAEVVGEKEITITAGTDAEVLVIDVPKA